MPVDLHRHDEYSLFDGLGNPLEMARLAKEYGYTALSQTNHGTMSGLVEHYLACKEAEIKPIMGVEAYFMPKFKEGGKRFHLCLYCKSIEGYRNLNRIVTYANVHNFYYKPVVDFSLLEKYNEGIICTSACISGFPSAMLEKGKKDIAIKALRKFKDIFGEDFYIEIQPYKLSEKGLQEKVNVQLMKLADRLKIGCVLTSDSHYGRKEDFDTFLTMHLMQAGKGKETEKEAWVRSAYTERYMPQVNDLRKRFIAMHQYDFVDIKERAKAYYNNSEKIIEKVDGDIFDKFELSLPVFKEGVDSEKLLLKEIGKGLKRRGKDGNKKYLRRCKQEFEVIKEHGFADYFLIVQEYVQWAKDQGIAVGPGRGSVCNCEIAYILGITEVDSIYFNLDFRRFLRKDKKKLPDIDIDFETSRRGEVIEHLIKKYKGKAVKICSFGMFKVDNLLNDLFKMCGVTEPEFKNAIKKYVNSHIEPETMNFDYEEIRYENKCKEYNARFNNILKHFSKMYKKIKYIGTHAAGVAIVGTNILDYVSVERHGKKYSSAYDMNNIEKINAVKFDMLGLRTLSITKELKELTGEEYSDEWLSDANVFKRFNMGDTDAIFQFERQAAANILMQIDADCVEDVCAANALNRPGPLSLGMPEQYGYNKAHRDEIKNSPYYEMTRETYGTIVYQEQISAICIEIGEIEWAQVDKVLKFMKGKTTSERKIEEKERELAEIRTAFVAGAKKHGIKKTDALDIWYKILTYSFNKGHALGYALIAIELMWYKVYYPMYFWYTNLKYCNDDTKAFKYKKEAINGGTVVLTPHINGTAQYGLKKVDGEVCIQEGLMSIKGVGEKAAMAIEAERIAHGDYKDIDDLEDRNEKRIVNARVLKALHESGACQMNKKKYFANVVRYNTGIISR